MKYTQAGLRLLNYNLRSKHWNDFATHTLHAWYRFSPDHSVSDFAWYAHKGHRNVINTTHGGALMTYMDYAMSAAIWDLSGGLNAYTLQLNNEFVRAARIDRWLFAQVVPTVLADCIELNGTVRVNDTTGLLVMKSYGKFTLPRQPKMLDITV